MSTRSAAELYENDFYAWTRQQAKELRRFARSRPNLPLDLEHVAEEIADLGKSQRDSLRSWTAHVLEHLLLLEHSPAGDPRRVGEIVNFRREIDRRLSGALRRDLRRQLPRLYDEVRSDLPKKLAPYGEAHIRFPERCPYTLDQGPRRLPAPTQRSGLRLEDAMRRERAIWPEGQPPRRAAAEAIGGIAATK